MEDFLGPQIGLPANNKLFKEKLQFSGVENTINPLVLGGISLGLNIIGGNKQANEEKKARNEAIESQYEYDKQVYEDQVEKIKADRAESIRNLNLQKINDLQLAAYKDKNAIASYNYEMQIRNKEQDSLNKQYIKSKQVTGLQLNYNQMSAQLAKQSQEKALREETQRLIFENQDLIIKQLQDEGEYRARGASGRSANKIVQSLVGDLGRKQAAMAESLLSAQTNTRAALLDIDMQKGIADLSTYADMMLNPGTLPVAPTPYVTPLTVFQYPRELEDFDFGPEPIEGVKATYTPSWTNYISDGLDLIATAIGGD